MRLWAPTKELAQVGTPQPTDRQCVLVCVSTGGGGRLSGECVVGGRRRLPTPLATFPSPDPRSASKRQTDDCASDRRARDDIGRPWKRPTAGEGGGSSTTNERPRGSHPRDKRGRVITEGSTALLPPFVGPRGEGVLSSSLGCLRRRKSGDVRRGSVGRVNRRGGDVEGGVADSRTAFTLEETPLGGYGE